MSVLGVATDLCMLNLRISSSNSLHNVASAFSSVNKRSCINWYIYLHKLRLHCQQQCTLKVITKWLGSCRWRGDSFGPCQLCMVTLMDLYVCTQREKIRRNGSIPVVCIHDRASCVLSLCCSLFSLTFLTMCTAEVKLLQVKFSPPTTTSNPDKSCDFIQGNTPFFPPSQRINGFPQSVLSSLYKRFLKTDNNKHHLILFTRV